MTRPYDQTSSLGWEIIRRRGYLKKQPMQSSPTMHPAILHVLKYFEYTHLPDRLQVISRPFCELAQEVAQRSPDNQETTVSLRKLLEAKDAAVRAGL